jgi:apolipoprotein N-acyltransferase
VNISSGKRFLSLFCALAAGLLLAAAFPKIDFAGGAWIAPGLLAFAAQNKKGWAAFRIGVIGGLSFWLVSLYWLLEIPYQWHSIPLGPAAGWLQSTNGGQLAHGPDVCCGRLPARHPGWRWK